MAAADDIATGSSPEDRRSLRSGRLPLAAEVAARRGRCARGRHAPRLAAPVRPAFLAPAAASGGFLLLLFVTLPFSVAGQPLFSLGPVVASFEGVSRAALIVCKVSASMLVIVTMLREDEPVRLAVALRGLHVPEPAVRLFMLTACYLELIRGEAQRLHDAMRMRGFRPRGNRHTWRSYGNLLGMLLVRALARAQRVEEAMLCRGYDGRFPVSRSLLRLPRTGWASPSFSPSASPSS
ncbi:energy-coupling factor transporter transmembrane component T family protein [Pseudoroseomonas wenyumeiae]